MDSKNPKGWPRDYAIAFWELYPNRVGKAKAIASLDGIRKAGVVAFDDLMDGLKRYIAKNDDRAWCNPATWLNQHRWLDEPCTPPPARAGPSPSLFGRPPPVTNEEILARIAQNNARRKQH